MPAVDPAPDAQRTEALDQQGQAECQRRLGPPQAQLALDRLHQQRKGVEHAAPGDQLRQRQPQDQALVELRAGSHAGIMAMRSGQSDTVHVWA
jgi:hypothetical protein